MQSATPPLILIHILAKDKAGMLPDWLKINLDRLDYPRNRIILYFRTNNNNDATAEIIHEWVDRQHKNPGTVVPDNWQEWKEIILDDTDLTVSLQNYGVHEWNPIRFKALAHLREEGINLAILKEVDFYYTVDVDNFTLPNTLKNLVAHNVPIVAPLISCADPDQTVYANYHNRIADDGYYLDVSDSAKAAYFMILNREVKGLIDCGTVHCTYLIRKDLLPMVKYTDGTDNYEYAIFSRRLRQLGVPQYLDNTTIYGCLSLRENLEACIERMKELGLQGY